MLISQSKEQVIEALKNDSLKNCGEIIEIEQSAEDFYCKAKRDICENRMIKYVLKGIAAYDIISSDSNFINECLAFIKTQSLNNFYLYIPSWFESPKEFEIKYAIKKLGTFADYIFPHTNKPITTNFSQQIISLQTYDNKLAKEFLLPEQLPGRPDFYTLFRVLILENKLPGGKIYAYIENNQIIAYLSSYIFNDNIYDIDHVYVLPHHRNKGIGAELVNKYIEDITSSGGIPRYGNAENELSRRLAQKTGFVETKCQNKYELKRV